jgi:cell cycle arrest protein BUB2
MSEVATAHAFNKILNQPKVSSKSRSSGDLDDGTKKLRRMILVDGIPSSVVCHIMYIKDCLSGLNAS